MNTEKPISLKSLAWKRLKKNRMAMASLVFIVLCVITSCLCYLIVTDKTSDANSMYPQLALKDPGFNIKFLKVKKDADIEHQNIFRRIFFGTESEFQFIPITYYKPENIYLEFGEYRGNEIEAQKQLIFEDPYLFQSFYYNNHLN